MMSRRWRELFVGVAVLGVAALLWPARADSNAKDPLERPTLKQSDFDYQGAFLMPEKANGWSTSWGFSGITCRRVGKELRFITGTHPRAADALYEIAYPGLSKDAGKWPVAKITAEWGVKPYGKKKEIKDGKEWGVTGGLYWDEVRKRLYFSFGSWYNIPPTNEVSLGYATLDGEPKPYGSWAAPAAKAHSQKIRGGSLAIPKWFADKYTGGRDLGLGFGGYYSGFSECSRGPFLAAAFAPTEKTKELDVRVLIDHPDAHWGTRNADYASEISWSPKAKGDVGYWGAKDEVHGAAVWIDLPDKHGLLILSTLGHGKIQYIQGDRYATRIVPWWWVYDPKDLALVAQGKKQPWQHRPASWKVDYKPRDGVGNAPLEVPGCCFDAQTRTLFVLVPMSVKAGADIRPLVHAYRVK